MAASLILAAFQMSVEEDEGSHRLDLSAGEQRPRSAHVYGGRRKERKCEAEASRPHGGFGRVGGQFVQTRCFTVAICFTIRRDLRSCGRASEENNATAQLT